MKSLQKAAAMTFLVMLWAGVGCNASAQPGQSKIEPGQPTTAPERSGMQIDPQATDALKRMSQALAKAQALSFETQMVSDRTSPGGQLVQMTRHGKVLVSRPDKVFAEVTGDDGNYALWYDATSLTFLNRSANTYAKIQVPASIDKMLDYLADKYDATIPLSDLLFPDPYAVLTEKVESGVYLGLHEVGGRKCHHLLFTQANVDWQIWIDAGEPPVPRKVVIVHKDQPGSPECAVLLDKWNLAAQPPADAFRFTAPKDANEIPMDQLIESRRGGKP